jgi:hypothetical protein
MGSNHIQPYYRFSYQHLSPACLPVGSLFRGFAIRCLMQPVFVQDSKNIMRDDETFEKYVMGNPNVHGDNHESSKVPNAKHPEVINSTCFYFPPLFIGLILPGDLDHHASGRTKAKANQASKDEMDEIHLQKQ